MSQNVVLNWSSGKDAAMAFLRLQQDPDFRVTRLLTTINSEADRVFMHGTREAVLELQAHRMGMPLSKIALPPSPDDVVYRNAMHKHLEAMKREGIRHAAFGDIFLEDLRQYREQQLAQLNFKGVFPLWHSDTSSLLAAVEDSGIEAYIICVNAAVLGKEFLGRKADRSLLQDLPAGVDPCGENGEYHTCVVDAPFFSSPVPFRTGETVFRTYGNAAAEESGQQGFFFLDMIPE